MCLDFLSKDVDEVMFRECMGLSRDVVCDYFLRVCLTNKLESASEPFNELVVALNDILGFRIDGGVVSGRLWDETLGVYFDSVQSVRDGVVYVWDEYLGLDCEGYDVELIYGDWLRLVSVFKVCSHSGGILYDFHINFIGGGVADEEVWYVS